MKKEIISFYQFFSLMVLFLLGSSIVFGLGLKVKQSVWLLLFISTAVGMVLLYFYLWVFKLSGYKNLMGALQQGFGTWIGKLIGLLYCSYFMYIASRVIMDFVFFIHRTLFLNIEGWIVSFTFLLVVAYGLSLGIEAVARSSEILLVVTLLFILMLMLLASVSEEFDLHRLTPVLPDGFGAVLKEIFPLHVTFPYGELIVFTLIFPLIQKHEQLRKRAWIPVAAGSAILILINFTIIALLSAEMAAIYSFPAIQAIQLIRIGEFIQHLQYISVLLFLMVVFIKVSIFTFAAVKGVSMIFNMPNEKITVSVICLLIFILTLYISPDFPTHVKIGLEIVPKYMHIPFQMILPALLVFVLLIKRYAQSKKGINSEA